MNSLSLDSGATTRFSATILGVIGFIFYLLSFQQVLRAAKQIDPEKVGSLTDETSVKDSLKIFFTSSILKYFGLDSILLAVASVLNGSMSLITEEYFGLKPTFLWLAALGIPIGGIISVGLEMRSKIKLDSKTRVHRNGICLALLLTLMLLLWDLAPVTDEKAAKSGLFFFGLFVGMFWSVSFSAAFALWLLKLKDESTGFIARANVIHNGGVEVITAVVFQLQAVLFDVVETNNDQDSSNVLWSLSLFGPVTVLVGLSLVVLHFIPYPKDKTFGWPFPPLFSPSFRILLWLYKKTGASADAIVFAKFCDYRTSFFSQHLSKSEPQAGPVVPENARLNTCDFRNYLGAFDKLGKEEKWWYSEDVVLGNILLSNEASFGKRLELIRRATSSILITTWSFDGSRSEFLAEELITRAQEGMDVRLIVDAVNLCFHEKKREVLPGDSDTKVLKRLVEGGVKVRMLAALHEDKEPAYVIGSHRKICLFDERWMITGGRNFSDEYAAFEESGESTFHDVDVLLEGDFSSTTVPFYHNLWNQSKIVGNLSSIGGGSLDETDYSIPYDDQGPGRRGSPSSNSSFFRSISDMSCLNLGHKCSLIQIDHKGGNPDGYDIILSTLLFLIETAESSIDLVFGYFQLFPAIDKALERAIARGIKIRLVTNSSTTSDLFFMSQVFRKAFVRLMELGVEIYIPSSDPEQFKEEGKFCLHYKLVLVDHRAALVGSWNCLGTSIFYDDDFGVVLFDQQNNGDNSSSA